jgi:membrane protein DedA with SNARE-associated domain
MANPMLVPLPSGPVAYLIVVAIVVASSIPVLAIVAAAEPFLIAAVLAGAADGRTSIWTLLMLVTAASVVGDTLSYWLGRPPTNR